MYVSKQSCWRHILHSQLVLLSGAHFRTHVLSTNKHAHQQPTTVHSLFKNYLLFTWKKGPVPSVVFVCKTWRSFTMASKYIRKSKRNLFSTEELLNEERQGIIHRESQRKLAANVGTEKSGFRNDWKPWALNKSNCLNFSKLKISTQHLTWQLMGRMAY